MWLQQKNIKDNQTFRIWGKTCIHELSQNLTAQSYTIWVVWALVPTQLSRRTSNILEKHENNPDIFIAQCIYSFCLILKLNSDHFPMQQSTTFLNGSILLYELGTESLYIMHIILVYYVHYIIWWLVCKTKFTCTKCILHTLSILSRRTSNILEKQFS